MIVQTTAEWDSKTQEFVLNSASDGANKNWISQGLLADKTVVLADLIINVSSAEMNAISWLGHTDCLFVF